MVHLIPSLLTNLYSMTAIEAKYVELCKYTVAYVGFNFLNKKCSCCRGGCATHVDPTYISPGDTWFDGSAVLYYGLVLVELVHLEVGGGCSLCGIILHKRVSPTRHFWRGQSAGWAQPLSRETRPYHSASCQWRQSFRIPHCVTSERQRSNNRCCFK